MRFCPRDGSPLVTERVKKGKGNESYVGQIISGRYRVMVRIGEGGMGSVYRVEHVVMGKHLAMKILHKDLCRFDHAIRRFEREARASSLLDHPNCVNVTDFGVAESGALFLTMELLEGKDLFDTLRYDRIFAPARAIRVMRQIGAGLAEAHARGVIHRDLKPENIFLVQHREWPDLVKILDFGIAKMLDGDDGPALTAQGTVFGTPEYLAPEQGTGHVIDHRADLYSVGIIMYRMLAGHLPFRGGNKMALIQRQISEAPKPFSQLRMPQEVPPHVEAVCFKLLAKDPDERYQTAHELIEALSACEGSGAAAAASASAAAESEVIWIDYSDGRQVAAPRLSTMSELPVGAAYPIAKWLAWAAVAAGVGLAAWYGSGILLN